MLRDLVSNLPSVEALLVCPPVDIQVEVDVGPTVGEGLDRAVRILAEVQAAKDPQNHRQSPRRLARPATSTLGRPR
jgi:hypothetical protein